MNLLLPFRHPRSNEWTHALVFSAYISRSITGSWSALVLLWRINRKLRNSDAKLPVLYFIYRPIFTTQNCSVTHRSSYVTGAGEGLSVKTAITWAPLHLVGLLRLKLRLYLNLLLAWHDEFSNSVSTSKYVLLESLSEDQLSRSVPFVFILRSYKYWAVLRRLKLV